MKKTSLIQLIGCICLVLSMILMLSDLIFEFSFSIYPFSVPLTGVAAILFFVVHFQQKKHERQDEQNDDNQNE